MQQQQQQWLFSPADILVAFPDGGRPDKHARMLRHVMQELHMDDDVVVAATAHLLYYRVRMRDVGLYTSDTEHLTLVAAVLLLAGKLEERARGQYTMAQLCDATHLTARAIADAEYRILSVLRFDLEVSTVYHDVRRVATAEFVLRLATAVLTDAVRHTLACLLFTSEQLAAAALLVAHVDAGVDVPPALAQHVAAADQTTLASAVAYLRAMYASALRA